MEIMNIDGTISDPDIGGWGEPPPAESDAKLL